MLQQMFCFICVLRANLGRKPSDNITEIVFFVRICSAETSSYTQTHPGNFNLRSLYGNDGQTGTNPLKKMASDCFFFLTSNFLQMWSPVAARRLFTSASTRHWTFPWSRSRSHVNTRWRRVLMSPSQHEVLCSLSTAVDIMFNQFRLGVNINIVFM